MAAPTVAASLSGMVVPTVAVSLSRAAAPTVAAVLSGTVVPTVAASLSGMVVPTVAVSLSRAAAAPADAVTVPDGQMRSGSRLRQSTASHSAASAGSTANNCSFGSAFASANAATGSFSSKPVAPSMNARSSRPMPAHWCGQRVSGASSKNASVAQSTYVPLNSYSSTACTTCHSFQNRNRYPSRDSSITESRCTGSTSRFFKSASTPASSAVAANARRGSSVNRSADSVYSAVSVQLPMDAVKTISAKIPHSSSIGGLLRSVRISTCARGTTTSASRQ